MRFMVVVFASPDSEAGQLPSEQELAEMGQFNEELAEAGMMVAGEGLRPTSDGVRLTFPGGEPTLTEGPFAGPNLVAGFWLIQAASKEEAIAWMRRAPFRRGETIEIRPLFEMEDLVESDPTGELMAQEKRLRERLESAAKT